MNLALCRSITRLSHAVRDDVEKSKRWFPAISGSKDSNRIQEIPQNEEEAVEPFSKDVSFSYQAAGLADVGEAGMIMSAAADFLDERRVEAPMTQARWTDER